MSVRRLGRPAAAGPRGAEKKLHPMPLEDSKGIDFFLKVFTETIMPQVVLTCLETGKFKTDSLSINLLAPIDRETASMNALIPKVLRRGTASLPDMDAVSERLDSLYGASLSPAVRKKGEIQVIGFYADFADELFLPEGGILGSVIDLMAEMLLRPATERGQLCTDYVESEKEQLLELIRGRINNKRSYSIQRLFEQMCAMEAYAVDKLGSEEAAENITPAALTEQYKKLLACSPLEIFYCGSAKPERVKELLIKALAGLPREGEEPDIGTDIWLIPLEDKPRVFEEELQVTQGKLAIGFRMGDCMEDPDTAAIRVFNGVFGGCVTSKLFMNVREKLSLAYFASSMVDMHKGVMAVSSGIEFDKYDAALNEIFVQLKAVQDGDFTDDELDAARRSIAGDYRSIEDEPHALEDFYLNSILIGPDCSPAELAQQVEAVTREQVADVAKGVVCDAIYFLRGPKEESNGD